MSQHKLQLHSVLLAQCQEGLDVAAVQLVHTLTLLGAHGLQSKRQRQDRVS